MASVRFICGTQTQHTELEARLSRFLHTEGTILFSSCFDANGGVFEVLLDDRDVVISDELNHASIIDGIRLCKATRRRYRNRDMADLEVQLKESAGARRRLIATDGVFSMDGYLAPAGRDLRPGRTLRRAGAGRRLARRRVRRADGRGHPRAVRRRGSGRHRHRHPGQGARWGVRRLRELPGPRSSSCCANGPGRTCSPTRSRRRSSPAPWRRSTWWPVGDEQRAGLRRNTTLFRRRMTDEGFDVLPGEHPITPVMFGDAKRAAAIADAMLDEGVYVIAFSYPVVPRDKARIRVQLPPRTPSETSRRACRRSSRRSPRLSACGS